MLQRWLVVIIGLPLLLAALLLCPDWVTVIVVCGIAAAAAYELLHTAGKKMPKCVYAFTILAAVAQEWVIYDAHTWQFYDSYQSVGMIRILCVPLALVTALFFVAVKDYGTPNAMPFADVATAMMGGTVFPMNLVLAGLVTNAIGQLGDLAMSLIKREAGVKDYSHIFLTHGGMLDRFDSTLFITPWIYLFVCAGML